jgi:hypothetical protein
MMRMLKAVIFTAMFLIISKLTFDVLLKYYILTFPNADFVENHRNRILILKHAVIWSCRYTSITLALLLGLVYLIRKW